MAKKQSVPIKITRPVNTGILIRSRLFKELDEKQDKNIIWIEGPAGSGKTTLISSYVADSSGHCLWYRIDEGDADLATFFYYLRLAGKKAAPRMRTALPLFTMEYLMGIPEFSRNFFDELFRRINSPGIIVFDNIHNVPPDSPMHMAILAGINRLPEGLRIVMISRNQHPDAYSWLIANQQLKKFTWEDLQLTQEESGQIIHMRMDGKLSPKHLELAYTATNGWTAGLQLLIEHMTKGDIGDSFFNAEVPEDIFNYFAGEIYNNLDSPLRQFLLHTSILPWMTINSAEAISGSNDATAFLNYLTSHNLFVEIRQGTPRTYKYHPLFREFLVRRAMNELTAKKIQSLQLQGAGILFESKNMEDGAALLVNAGAWEQLAGVIIEHAPGLAQQGRTALLKSLLDNLPEQLVTEVPWLLFWYGVCCFPFEIQQGRTALEKSYSLFSRQSERTGMILSCLAFLESCVIDLNMEPVDHWLREAKKNLSALEGPLPPPLSDRLTKAMLFSMLFNQPQNPDLKQWGAKAEQIIHRDRDTAKNLELGSFLLLYYKWTGATAKARILVDLLKPSADHPDVLPKDRIVFYLCEIPYLWFDCNFNEALVALEKGLKLVEDSGVKMFLPGLLCQGAFTHIGRNDMTSAEAMLSQVTEMLPMMSHFDRSEYYSIYSVISLSKGNFYDAVHQGEESLRLVVEGGTPYGIAMASLGMGIILTYVERYDEAAQHFERTRQIGADMESIAVECYYSMYAANLELKRGNETVGLDLLGKALELGRNNDYYDFVFFSREILVKLCVRALQEDIDPAYVRTLIKKHRLRPDNLPVTLENWPWPVMIYTLGRFEIIVDGKAVKVSGKAQKKPLELLKVLIASGDKAVPADTAMDMLWPDSEGDTSQQSLRTTLHRLRKMLGSENTVLYQNRYLSLDKKSCWVDTFAFEGCIERSGLPDQIQNETALLRKAIELYKGHFLNSETTEFLTISYREKLKRAYLGNVGKYGKDLEKSAQWSSAADCYQKAQEVDDLAEEFYRRLMVCNQKLGRWAEAIEVYNRCRKTLSSVLRVEPSSETKAVYNSLLK